MSLLPITSVLPVPGCIRHLAGRKHWFLICVSLIKQIRLWDWWPDILSLAHGSGLSASFAAALPVLVNF